MLKDLICDLDTFANPEKAKILSRFFKTGKGEYGEGDKFLGIMVPQQRAVAKKYKDLSFSDIEKLLKSKYHEYRLTALLILVMQYKDNREAVFRFYINNIKYINNWDLVDLTAPNIVGNYLLDKQRKLLYTLVKSKNLWERRIVVVATFAFIRVNDFRDSLKIAELLLHDKHDLIHKAVGWMLREVGKRDQKALEDFLKRHYHNMPRTMLRYAIERFDDKKRKKFLLH